MTHCEPFYFRVLLGSTKAKLVGQVLLERLVTGSKASNIGHYLPTNRGYEASYAHAQYTSGILHATVKNCAEGLVL